MDPHTIAKQVMAYQAMTVPELVVEYTRLFGKPPHCKNRRWLWRNCAWAYQADLLGGLPDDAQVVLERLVADIVLPPEGAAKPRPRPPKGGLLPGTVLTKTWRGTELRVQVTDAGFVWNGVPYGSLSAVAQAITGQHWSGALFFGLKQRKRRGPAA